MAPVSCCSSFLSHWPVHCTGLSSVACWQHTSGGGRGMQRPGWVFNRLTGKLVEIPDLSWGGKSPRRRRAQLSCARGQTEKSGASRGFCFCISGRVGGWAGIRRTTAEGEGAVSSCAAGADEAWRNHSDRHILHALFFLEASFLLHPGGPPPGQQSCTHPGLGGQVGVGRNSSPSLPIPSLPFPSLTIPPPCCPSLGLGSSL